jgi:uncharacterized protein with HEPN domain
MNKFSKIIYQIKLKEELLKENFEIIGEAINKLLKINPNISISYARIIVDLRNRVIHAYDSVDDILIWKIIVKDLPILLEEATKLINEN